MSTKEFWEDEPDLFWAYRFSYINRQKENYEIFNNQACLQGAYFYEAISVALSNAFNKKKTSYREQPFDFKNKDNNTEKPKQINVLEEKLKQRAKEIEKMLRGENKNE